MINELHVFVLIENDGIVDSYTGTSYKEAADLLPDYARPYASEADYYGQESFIIDNNRYILTHKKWHLD